MIYWCSRGLHGVVGQTGSILVKQAWKSCSNTLCWTCYKQSTYSWQTIWSSLCLPIPFEQYQFMKEMWNNSLVNNFSVKCLNVNYLQSEETLVWTNRTSQREQIWMWTNANVSSCLVASAQYWAITSRPFIVQSWCPNRRLRPMAAQISFGKKKSGQHFTLVSEAIFQR